MGWRFGSILGVGQALLQELLVSRRLLFLFLETLAFGSQSTPLDGNTATPRLVAERRDVSFPVTEYGLKIQTVTRCQHVKNNMIPNNCPSVISKGNPKFILPEA